MDGLSFARAARDHLEKEEALLRELIACLNEEREALCTLDSPAVARSVAAKESLAMREQALAASRRALITEAAAQISEESGGAVVDLSLGEIIERLRPPGGQDLLARRARVRSLASQAQRLNALNRHLCAHALSCLRGYLSLTGRTQTDTYGASGRLLKRVSLGGYARRA